MQRAVRRQKAEIMATLQRELEEAEVRVCDVDAEGGSGGERLPFR